MTYTTKSGKTYTLVQMLGAGGEGAVYSIEGESDKVAKIYKPTTFKTADERGTKERKLKAMIDMNIPVVVDGILKLVWPLEVLYRGGEMAGFTMPRLETKYKIYDMYRVDGDCVRERLYPKNNWKYSVQFAYNMASVVDYLHRYDVVIGDLNQNNIAVDEKTGAAILLDCDSFDITDSKTGEHFPCTVGLPEILAPELQSVGKLCNARFTKESDCFSLAIHIFRFLMNNADPFGGVITRQSSLSDTPANHAVMNGECAYVREVEGKKIPDWSLTLDFLPDNIAELFKRTFDYTATTAIQNIKKRATAHEWCKALLPLGVNENNVSLKTCDNNPKHVYPAHNAKCPFCKPEENERTDKSFDNEPNETTYKKATEADGANTKEKRGKQFSSKGKPKSTAALSDKLKSAFYNVITVLAGLVAGNLILGVLKAVGQSAFGTNPPSAAIFFSLLAIVVSTVGTSACVYRFKSRFVASKRTMPKFLPLILIAALLAAMIFLIMAIFGADNLFIIFAVFAAAVIWCIINL